MGESSTDLQNELREKETQRPIIYDVTLHHNLQGMRFSRVKGNNC